MAGNNIIVASSISPQIILSQQLGTSDTALYTVPAGQSVKLAQGSLCNTTSSAVTVYLSLVKAGGTVGDGTHRVISGTQIAANDTLPLGGLIGGHMLGPGDIVAAYAGTATAVDIVVSGTVHA